MTYSKKYKLFVEFLGNFEPIDSISKMVAFIFDKLVSFIKNERDKMDKLKQLLQSIKISF